MEMPDEDETGKRRDGQVESTKQTHPQRGVREVLDFVSCVMIVSPRAGSGQTPGRENGSARNRKEKSWRAINTKSKSFPKALCHRRTV